MLPILLLLTQVLSMLGNEGLHGAQDSERGLMYLVYAGPYASSPASTFGHLYLAFADSADHAPASWDVYTFNADTNNAGMLRYVLTGISGGFLGRFEHTKYLSKVQDYVIDEDRDLWVFQLNLNPHQSRSIRESLRIATSSWFPYTFFKKNCAYYIQELLHRETGLIQPPIGVTSPASVVREVIAGGMVQHSFFKPRMSESLRSSSESLSKEFETMLKENTWQEALAKIAQEEDLSSEQLKFSLLYFWWAQKDLKEQLPADVEAAMEALRFRGIRDRASASADAEWIGHASTPGYFHPYSRIESGVGAQRNNSNFYVLGIRAGAYDALDMGPTAAPTNQLAVLSARLLFDFEAQTILLDEAVLLSQVALVPFDWLQRKRSWKLELAGKRGGVQGEYNFHTHAKYGTGVTKKAYNNLYVFTMVEAGISHAIQKRVLAAGGFNSGLIWIPSKSLRIGGDFLLESTLGKPRHSFRSGSLWLGLQATESILLNTRIESSSHYTRLRVGISRYW